MAAKAATVKGAQPSISADALEELRTQLRGPALTSGDPGHSEVREVFNAMHTGKPDLTVRCSGTADVVDAVNFARSTG